MINRAPAIAVIDRRLRPGAAIRAFATLALAISAAAVDSAEHANAPAVYPLKPVRLIAAQPANLCPLLEYLIKWNEIHQFFLKAPLKPSGGVVRVPDTPGLGMDLDPDKIEQEQWLSWS